MIARPGAHEANKMAANKPDPGPDVVDDPIEARVAARTEELSALSTSLLRMMENERSQLAKELHDELGGLITAAKMDMAWLQSHIGTALDAPSQEKFRSVVQMLNQAMMLKRRVVESLRPSLLDHFGLPVALRSHFDECCGHAGIEYIATLPEEILDLEPAVQLTLFRVAQEALSNLVARGSAKHVELVIEPEGEGYTMTVGDDGGAMNAEQLKGLAGMRHRVQGAGGKFDVEAASGQGNRITVRVPRAASAVPA
jgi:signal transduction histidine kinase